MTEIAAAPSPHTLRPVERRLAWGGVVGPVAFVTAWAVGSASRDDGYSAIDDAISRLAEVGTSTVPLMNAGFLAFGVAVPAYSLALRRALPGPAWRVAAATGIATLFVAALPLGTNLDTAHGVAAGVGYLTLAAVPLLAAVPFRRAGRRVAAAASVVAGLASGAFLVTSLVTEANGLWQRMGLGVVDVWLVATGLRMARTGRLLPAHPCDTATVADPDEVSGTQV